MLTSQGRVVCRLELTLSFGTKPEKDLVVGTLHGHGCEMMWTTNSSSAAGHWGTWVRSGAEPTPGFNGATRGYAACGDPAPFTAFNDFNSTTTAIENLEYAHSKGGPFFIGMGVFKPHYPWHVPKQFADLYEQHDIALPNVSAQHAPIGMVPWAFDKGLDGLTTFQILNDTAPQGSLSVPVNGPNSTMPRWAFQSMRKGYYSAVSWSDHLIGMMLAKMDALDVTSTTITVLTSDHVSQQFVFSKTFRAVLPRCDQKWNLLVRSFAEKPAAIAGISLGRRRNVGKGDRV